MLEFLQYPPKFSKIQSFSLVVFLLTIGVSLTDTFWAVYLYQYTHSDALVGLISAFLTGVSLLSFLVFIPVFEKYDNSRLYQWSIFLMGICYILFLFTESIWIIVLLGMIMSILTVVRINCFGIILKENSKQGEIAKNVGMAFTIISFAWVVGPLIAGQIAEIYGIPLLFLLSSFFFFMALLSYKMFNIGIRRKKVTLVDGHFLKNIKGFFQNKQLVRSYLVAGSSPLWWSFVYIYMPVHIVEQGLGLQWVAYFLFAVIIPILLFEYYFNILADKLRYRKAFLRGNIFIALLLLVAFFISNIYALLGLLVLGSIGIALVEPAAESYFFLISPKKGIEKNYSIYNTSLDVFAILGKMIIAGTLLFLNFQYSFLVLALFFLFLAWVSLSLKQVSGAKY